MSRTGRIEQIYSGFSFYTPAEDTVLTELFSNRASGCNFDDFKQHTASTLSLGIDESKENEGFDTKLGIRERNLDEINKTNGKMIPEQEVKTFFHNKFDCARKISDDGEAKTKPGTADGRSPIMSDEISSNVRLSE